MQHFLSLALSQRLLVLYTQTFKGGFVNMIPGPPRIIKCTTKILYISYDALVHIITKKDSNFFLQRFFVSPSMTAKFTMSVLAQT